MAEGRIKAAIGFDACPPNMRTSSRSGGGEGSYTNSGPGIARPNKRQASDRDSNNQRGSLQGPID